MPTRRRRTLFRVRRTGVVAAVLLAALAGSPGSIQAHQNTAGSARSAGLPATTADDPGGLPAGWRLTGEGAARQLVWRSDEPVPISDAGVTFYSGDRFLGRPVGSSDG